MNAVSPLFPKLLVYDELLLLSAGRPPVLSTAEAVGIVTAVVIITLIIAVVGSLFLCNRRYVTTKHLANASKYDRFMLTAN